VGRSTDKRFRLSRRKTGRGHVRKIMKASPQRKRVYG